MKRVLIATGGTGGHIYPSVALAQQLKSEGYDILLSGAMLSRNPYLKETDFQYEEISSAPGIKGLPYVAKGTLESYLLMNRFKPDLIVGFGSYTSFPLLAAGVLKNIPLILWAADAHPGKVIRWFSPYAKVTALQFYEAAAYLKGKSIKVSTPLRENFKKESCSRETSLAYYGLKGDKPILLIMGGSQGAKFLNDIVPLAISHRSELTNIINLDILHIAGSLRESERVHSTYQKLGIKALVKPYEEALHHAWRIATIACTRAGAISCAEQLEFEVPGVLIPFPSATDAHQEKNGALLSATGLTEVSLESKTSPETLRELIKALLESASFRREQLSLNKKNQSSKTLTNLVKETLYEF